MTWLSQLTERPMYCGDEIRKLTGPHRMMPYIAPDYFHREMLVDLFSFHDILPELFPGRLIYARRQQIKESAAASLRNFTRVTTWLPKK
jgi:hypothetical protein